MGFWSAMERALFGGKTPPPDLIAAFEIGKALRQSLAVIEAAEAWDESNEDEQRQMAAKWEERAITGPLELRAQARIFAGGARKMAAQAAAALDRSRRQVDEETAKMGKAVGMLTVMLERARARGYDVSGLSLDFDATVDRDAARLDFLSKIPDAPPNEEIEFIDELFRHREEATRRRLT